MAELPPRFFEHVSAFRRVIAAGMQHGLGAIQALELTLVQGIALFELADGGPCTLSALQGRVGRSQAATSHLVQGLVDRRLVVRAPDPEDGRRRLLMLTEDGQAAVTRIEDLRRVSLRRALEPVPADTLERLDDALAGVLRALAVEVGSSD